MELFQPILALILTIIFIGYTAAIDAEHLRKKQHIYEHKNRFIQRMIFFIALGLCNPIYALASALLFSAMFDQTLNWLRQLEFWYLGNTSAWDKFFNRKPILYISIKILCFMAGISLFLI